MYAATRTIFYLTHSQCFAEPIPNDQVTPMDHAVVLFKGIYISELALSTNGLQNGNHQLTQDPPATLLKPFSSYDGPPNWSAIVYRHADTTTVNVREEYAAIRSHYRARPENAIRYHADPPGGFSWDTDLSSGRSGYFLTGGAGLSALWRITRIQVDALNRQVLTFAPVQLTPVLATPLFDKVPLARRKFLDQHFKAFQQAIARNAPYDAVDRANNLAEGIVNHCLSQAGVKYGNSLSESLGKAKTLLQSPSPMGISMTHYGYHLAHQIRILHGRLHENQSVAKNVFVRPEVGLNLAVTVSELLVECHLGKY